MSDDERPRDHRGPPRRDGNRSGANGNRSSTGGANGGRGRRGDDRQRGDGPREERYRGDRPGGDRRDDRSKRGPRSGGGDRGSERHGRNDGPRHARNDGPRRDGTSGARGSGRPPFERRDRAPRPEADEAPAGERIAKRLARAGIASRRDAERMIEAGRVSVNGAVIDTPATLVTRGDRVAVDGTDVPAPERTRLWLLHKPAGLVTTNRDPEGRPTVFDALPDDMPRAVSVGRLDINTEGLLLLTNDGGLARVLELPATGWLRRYRVRAHGKVRQAQLDELKHGSAVDGVFYGAIEASIEREQGSNMWLTLALREGKNREVKNVLGALGLEVTRLIRTSYGPFQLGDLPPGEVREIKGRTLRDQLGERLIEEAGADFEGELRAPQRPKRDERAGEDEGRRPPRKHGDWVAASASPFERPRKRGEPRDREAEARARREGPTVRRIHDPDGGRYHLRDAPPEPFKRREPRKDGPKRHVWRAGEDRAADARRRDEGEMQSRPRKPGERAPRGDGGHRNDARGNGGRGDGKREDRARGGAKRFGGGERPRGNGPRRFDPDRRSGGDRPGGRFGDRRGNDRADNGGRSERGPCRFGDDRRSSGDRPRRDDRSRDDRSRDDRSRGERASREDRGTERPGGDRPARSRGFRDRPGGGDRGPRGPAREGRRPERGPSGARGFRDRPDGGMRPKGRGPKRPRDDGDGEAD